LVVGVRDPRGVDGDHPLDQIPCDVADGVEFGVARLAAGLEVGELGHQVSGIGCPVYPQMSDLCVRRY
jgi:hypothetical protein